MDWFKHFFEETLAVWGYLFWQKFAGEESDEDSKDQESESDEEDKIQDDTG